MPLVNRLLDAFFRTLDAVEIARERFDKAIGRQKGPEPWASDWSPTPEAPSSVGSTPGASSRVGAPEIARQREEPSETTKRKAAAVNPARSAKVISSAPAKKSGKPSPTSSKPSSKIPAKKKASKKPRGTNRKGSVDRKGEDYDSPRAKAIVDKIKQQKIGVITEDATEGGKKVLARVLWSLWAADEAGSELGLTAADASALLSLAAKMEVFSTNIARTCRDVTDLIEESELDGRSKRYKLTALGRQHAIALPKTGGA